MLRDATGGWLYSSQDLTAYLSCHHAAALNREVFTNSSLRDWLTESKRSAKTADEVAGFHGDPPHIRRGNLHEATVLASYRTRGFRVEDCTSSGMTLADLEAGYAKTIAAMQAGADVIYQGVLLDAPWFGFSDFLVKVEGIPSRFGDYAYEVHDTKLARSLHVAPLIQLAHYGLILERMQEAPPPRLVVVLGTGDDEAWPFEDAAPYVRLLRTAVQEFHRDAPPTTPEPIAACGGCRWHGRCDELWGPDDLSRVHRLNRRQRRLLLDAGIATISDLASAADTSRPDRIGADTFTRLRAQAAVQSGSSDFDLVRPHLAIGALADVRPPHPLDIYFDLEGDPFAAEPTLDYLWAFCGPDGNYEHRWAHDPAKEREAFTWFLDQLRDRDAQGGDWHVYHYNAYETASIRRIAKEWPDAAQCDALVAEVDDLIERRFDDLYRRVEAGLRTRDGSTSLKVVEVLAGYRRDEDPAAVAKGDDSIRVYEMAIEAGVDSTAGAELLEGIRQYNQHDVRATLAVHQWLLSLGESLSDDELVYPETDDYVPSDQVLQRAAATEELEGRLAEACATAEKAGVRLTSGLTPAGGRLLASLLAWHRREEVVQWVDFYRLCDWARSGEVEPDADPVADVAATVLREELAMALGAVTDSGIRPGTEHESVLQDLVITHVQEPEGRKRKRTFTVSCRPGAWKVKEGDTLKGVALADCEPVGQVSVEQHDAHEGTAVVSTTADVAQLHALVVQPFTGSDAPWQALMRLGEAALVPGPDAGLRLALGVLDRSAPVALAEPEDESAQDRQARARTAAASLRDGELLPIQGPPGTGKTHLAAQLVLDQVQRSGGAGCRIGITANSHKVIDNLLTAVLKRAASAGVAVRAFHVDGNDDDARHQDVIRLQSGNDIAGVFADGDEPLPTIVGATKYGWSRPELVESLDLLIIDEAGQVALADALGVLPAAPRAIALGDPQQLAAPIQATHEPEAKVSLLQHLVGDRSVIDPAAGVFLDVSYRMCDEVCRVVGRLAYESELTASEVARRRIIEGPGLSVAGRDIPVARGVWHLPVEGDEGEQVAAAVELVEQLTSGRLHAGDPQWRADDPTSGPPLAPLGSDQMLVVAPHNATVNRLRAALDGIEVGTVDKFQGRQAHVVVYVMGRDAVEPRDVPFLYELNRVNVALSRARLMAVVVTGEDACLPPVGEPEHLRLASRFAAAMVDPAPRTDSDMRNPG